MKFNRLIFITVIISILFLSACNNEVSSDDIGGASSAKITETTTATTVKHKPSDESSQDDSEIFEITDYDIKNSNQNARLVYVAASTWLAQKRNSGEDFKKFAGKLLICRGDKVGYDNKGYIDINGDAIDPNINIAELLDDNFSGSYAFVISDNADTITYALWSKELITEGKQFKDNNELLDYCTQKRQIVGCFPTLDVRV